MMFKADIDRGMDEYNEVCTELDDANYTIAELKNKIDE